jgi:hypothetical protein
MISRNRKIIMLVAIFLFWLCAVAGEKLVLAAPDSGMVLHLFYSSACSSCHEALAVVSKVKETYPDLKVKYHNIIYPDHLKLKLAFCKYYQVPDADAQEIPLAFIGNRYLNESQLRQEYLEKLVRSLRQSPMKTPAEKEVLAAHRTADPEIKSVGLVTVITAGLIDGINPCAFVTLTFLMSLLYVQHASRKRIVIVSIFYSGAVFVTYLAAGLGLSTAIGAIERFSWLLEALEMFLGIVALVLGLMSFRDYLAMKRGDHDEVSLKLPPSVSAVIKKVLKKGSNSILLPLGAAAAGVIVSVLEFMCTGQVYLPTIMYMRTISALSGQAFFLLVIYNLAFIIPLLIVFGITFVGSSSFGLVKAGNRLYPVAKLALGIVFLALGIFLVDSAAKVLMNLLF